MTGGMIVSVVCGNLRDARAPTSRSESTGGPAGS